MILIQGVHKKQGGKYVLRNIHLNIKKGDFISLIGPSGAGKSSLLRIISKADSFEKGKVYVDGEDISYISRVQIPRFRRKIGVVFQDFKLLEKKTAFENVSFALEVAGASQVDINDIVPKVLSLVSLEDKMHSFPHQMSGGEQQRVAIARALIHKPPILLADEPTGNLDSNTGWEIIQLLQRINNYGTTVIMATHDQSVVNSIRRRVVQMDNGMITRDQQTGRYIS